MAQPTEDGHSTSGSGPDLPGPGPGSGSGPGIVSTGSKQVKAAEPLHKRIMYGLAAASMQNLVVRPAMAGRHWTQRMFPPATYPTIIKTYESRPKLPVRIFFPKSYDRASPSRALPLLLSIHGGGFVVGEPADNDAWNAKFCDTHTALVVALNYAKAPTNAFPGPQLDLEAQIAAVFADADLAPHIDLARVGIAGFSAGGALTLAVSEVPAVREKVTAGIVPVYPVVDFSVSPEVKATTRRYKPELGGTRGRNKDVLLGAAGLFDWCYIPVGQDLCDPLLSTIYANRSDLPRRVWILGCELDMLGHEAWRAACKFAGRTVPGMDQPIGQEEVAGGGKLGTLITSGDERFAFDVKDADGEVRWLCLSDTEHGFDMAASMGADKQTAQDGIIKRDALIQMMGEWLFRQ